MNRLARLSILLCLAVLLANGCGPSQAPAPTAVPSQPAVAATPTAVPPTPTEVAPEVVATGTPAPAAPLPSVTPLPPAAVATDTVAPPSPAPAPELIIASTAFAPGGEIPVRYSCFGENLSLPLTWSGLPEGTVSLALVVDDADSQPPGFVHWVVYNIPPAASGLPEALPAQGELDDGVLQGTNDFAPLEGQAFPGGAAINGVGYGGPCPPGRHRYVFTLYALDAQLDLAAEATADQVLTAIQGHILGQALLAGMFTPPE